MNLFIDISLILILCLTLAIIVPLMGVLVRFRANYNPKALQLDTVDGEQVHTGPIVRTYFGMIKRVYKIEGWNGFYKGLMPTVLSTSVFTLIILLFVYATPSRQGSYLAPEAGALGTLFYSVCMMLLSLPSAILTCRSITTPIRLPYFNPVKSICILFTPTERRRPWIIYLTPGLLLAEVLHIFIDVLVLGPLKRILLPDLAPGSIEKIADIPLEKFLLYFFAVILGIAVLTPLEVIATRLTIQRNHSLSDYDSISHESDGDMEDINAHEIGVGDAVIGFRNERDPYLGLVDCVQKVCSEEGWPSLYRAWWITLLGGICSAFV